MFEVIRHKEGTSYKLAYKFKAGESHKKAGGELWEGQFKYKITGTYPYHLDGMYFDAPVLIDNNDFNSWFKSETLGMREVPAKHVQTLEKIFSEPDNHAKNF